MEKITQRKDYLTYPWMFSCLVIGWFLSTLFSASPMDSIYINYKDVLNNFAAFCWSMTVAFITAPLMAIYMWKIRKELPQYHEKKIAVIIKFILIIISLFYFFGFFAPDYSKSGIAINIINNIVKITDWIGAFLIIIILFYCMILNIGISLLIALSKKTKKIFNN